ncbi:aldehyde dehydrogenase family protein [Gracilibacillus salitolerans]|uniref:Aldehyde dehydrogenase family protein n=1 Tax=Gracilibacillus salitolerans TaxID=2663022 RepID=A0A5Q2TKE4_9BACI|nr:aldehyde dehydrogenase family protein [Gracilibacillus salitolerans]QGH35409.1 aldehyde dehydrogenase family protein [Gracilibacillus salitolerans]
MELNEKDIQTIIDSVLKNVEAAIDPKETQHTGGQKQQHMKMKQLSSALGSNQSYAVSHRSNQNGVFDSVDDAIEAAQVAQQKWMNQYKLADKENIIQAIRQAVKEKVQYFAKTALEETGIGNYEDKIEKLSLTVEKTPGTEILETETFSGDDGLTFVEQTPFGVIGAVTPVTNPIDTIVNNGISMIAAGNAVVFNVHPSAKNGSREMIQLLNQTIVKAGGPENLLTMVKEPTIETVQKIANHSSVKLLTGTGGPGMVKSLLRSGKKAIGAGAGNPPVIVDETADLSQAAKDIVEGASFDNNLLCIAEKEVFVVDQVADDLIFELLNQNVYMLDHQQLEKVMNLTLKENTEGIPGGCSYLSREYLVAKEWVGKDASRILEQIGVTDVQTKLLICEVDANHPYVQLEQLMPILPIVRVKSIDEAIERAVAAEHGNRHTAVMHSNHIGNVTKFAKSIGTTIFVNNGSSLSGVGFRGEGFTTMTIAGPTGEGVTSARTFTRQRRTVIASGGFNIRG